MNDKCPLFSLQSKKQLKEKLSIKDNKYIKGNFQDEVHIFIDSIGKPRLIEAPSQELKNIQSSIKDCLHMCSFPDFVFSGVKNKTYINNALLHKNCKFMFKADISAFFPNISRNTVYSFFKNDLCVSSDVAKILTDLCTVDITSAIEQDFNVKQFVEKKKIRQTNHLCTGSPASPLLSFLVNRKMFEELHNISLQQGCTFSVYVDDIFLSSQMPIPKAGQKKVLSIITKYGYNVSKRKVIYYTSKEYKKITGVIITPDNKLLVPNRLKKKIVNGFSKGKYTVDDKCLKGMLYAAKHVDNNAFPNIQKYVFEKK